MVEELILKLFISDKNYLTKYYKYVRLSYIKNNYSNIYKLFIVVNSYYNKYKDSNSISKDNLLIHYNSSYYLEDSERKQVEELIDRILAKEITNVDALAELLEEHRRRALAGDIAKVALDVEEGSAKVKDLIGKFQEFELVR